MIQEQRYRNQNKITGQDTGTRIKKPEYRIQVTGTKIHELEHRNQDTRTRIQEPGYRTIIQESGYRKQDLQLGSILYLILFLNIFSL